MQELHAAACVSASSELTLVQPQLPRRALGSLGVVGHHDDGLALLAVHQLQQVEDLFRRRAIQVAGRFVADQQRGIGDQCPCNCHALLLATRQLRRPVSTAVSQADEMQGRARRAPDVASSTAW